MIYSFFITNLKYYFKSGLMYHIFIYNLIILLIMIFLFKNNEIFNYLWLIIFISTFLSLDLLFKQDFIDGRLEIIYLSSFSLYLYTLFKYIFFWVFCQLPFILFIILFQEFDFISCICLMLGSIACSLLGGLMYVLTFGIYEKTLLLSIMVFPLFIPILVFGTSLIITFLLQFVIFLIIIIPFITTYVLIKNIH